MCKFKVGDKVKTRNGTDVEIVCVDDRLFMPILGIRTRFDGSVVIDEWSKDGVFLHSMEESPHDILPPSRTVTLYQALVIAPGGRYYIPGTLYQSEDSEEIRCLKDGGYKVVRLLTEYPIEVELL